MIIAGITPCSLLDFPDRLSCILFTQGCNMRCGYCHNPEMVIPHRDADVIPWDTVMEFLRRRRGLLEGVVFCGGEPTLHRDLSDKIQEVRQLGFAVKLDTNGTHPHVLEQLLGKGLVNYVAMDYKTTIPKLASLCRAEEYGKTIHTSLAILQQSKVPYEIRTTVIREYHSAGILHQMAADLMNVPLWYLQSFRSGKTLDPAFQDCHAYSRSEMQNLLYSLQQIAPGVRLRGDQS